MVRQVHQPTRRTKVPEHPSRDCKWTPTTLAELWGRSQGHSVATVGGHRRESSRPAVEDAGSLPEATAFPAQGARRTDHDSLLQSGPVGDPWLATVKRSVRERERGRNLLCVSRRRPDHRWDRDPAASLVGPTEAGRRCGGWTPVRGLFSPAAEDRTCAGLPVLAASGLRIGPNAASCGRILFWPRGLPGCRIRAAVGWKRGGGAAGDWGDSTKEGS
jgi:hypothetical protein